MSSYSKRALSMYIQILWERQKKEHENEANKKP